MAKEVQFDDDGRLIYDGWITFDHQQEKSFHNFRGIDAQVEQQAPQIPRMAITELFRENPDFARSMHGSAEVPLGISKENHVLTLGPGRNALILTAGPQDAVGHDILRSAATSAHRLSSQRPSNLMVQADVSPYRDGWSPVRRLVRDPYNRSSISAAMLGGNDELFAPYAQSGPQAGMLNFINQTLSAPPDQVEQIRKGHMLGGIDTRHGFIPLVGPHNRIMAENVNPGDLNNEWGVSLEFLIKEFKKTPAARMLGFILHVDVEDLLRAKQRQVEALLDIAGSGEMQVIASNDVLRQLPRVRDHAGIDTRPLEQAARDIDWADAPSNGFHLISGGQAKPYSTFRPEDI